MPNLPAAGAIGFSGFQGVSAFTNDVPAVVLRSTCVSYGEGISFLPLLDLADRAEEVDDGAPPLGDLSSADAAFAAARALVERQHDQRHTAARFLQLVAHASPPIFLDSPDVVGN